MTDAEVITLSEITSQSIVTVEGAVSSANSALLAALRVEITTWNENRNDVDMTLKGEVNLETQKLLNAISARVCTWLGFPSPLNGICSQLPGSVVVSSTLSW
jgi:hypothetical protein